MTDTELTVDGVLEDPGPPVPDRGDEWTIALMLYTVIRVAEGEYPHPQLYVGHEHPGVGASAFQPGARHRMKLTEEFPEHANLLAPADIGDRGVFYCPSFEVLA